MWARGRDMPDKLDLKTKPPEDILENVGLFIEGKAEFHELPPKQGRKRRVIRTLVDLGGDSTDVSRGTAPVGESVQPEQRVGGSRLSRISTPAVQPREKRKTVRRRFPSTDIPKSNRSTTTLVAPKATTMEPPKGPEVVIKKSRGRPRKVK